MVVNVEVWKKAPNGLFIPITSGQMGGGNGPAGSPTYQPSFTGTIYPATGQSSGTYYCVVKSTFYNVSGQGSPTTTVQTASVVIP